MEVYANDGTCTLAAGGMPRINVLAFSLASEAVLSLLSMYHGHTYHFIKRPSRA